MRHIAIIFLVMGALLVSGCGEGSGKSPDFRYVYEMYEDSYFPRHLVDKVKDEIAKVVGFIEEGGHSTEQIQAKFDEMTIAINELNEEFWENDSEIETAARESIGRTVDDILKYYKIGIDVEEAIRERDW